MSGGLMQLVAYGAQDVYLTGNPQITFFKVAYRRHTNFAMQAMTVVASGASGFDKVMNFTIPRNGDLIMNTYLKAEIKAVPASDKKFAFVKRLGHALIDYITLTIGGSQIDKQYGMWLDLWYELTHTKSQEKGYKQMIGEVPELTKMTSAGKKGYMLFVPLQFWFCRNPGLALPLIALQYHEVKVELKTARKEELICYESGFETSEAFKSIELGDVSLLVNYVFLDSEERRKFAQVGHEYLIEQVQFTGSVPLPTASADSRTEVHHAVQLNFNHPSKELVWAVRNGLTRGNKFLTYTADEDWSVAIDEAADKIIDASTRILTTGEVAGADGNVKTEETFAAADWFIVKDGELYELTGDVKVEFTNGIATTQTPKFDTVISTEKSTLDMQISLLDTELTDIVLVKKGTAKLADGTDLFAKIHAVEISKTLGANVINHSLTVADVSVPLSSWSSSAGIDGVVVNIPFNYGMFIDGSGNPVTKGLIQFNGQDRFDEREGMFFNCVQPLQHHTCSPADGVNVYSFAINPENHQPSGSANLSRIDTTYLQLRYKGAPTGYFSASSQLFVFDFSYNVLRVMSGMGGLAYSN